MLPIQVRDEIEAKVLQAAAEILWEGGLDALTMEEVTKRSGVAKTTVYRRYASAEELGIRAIKSLVLAELDSPDTGSLRGDLVSHYQTFCRVSADSGFQRVVLSLMSASIDNPELQVVRAEMDERRIQVVRHMIESARDRGEVTRQLTDDQLVAVIEGPMFIMRVHQLVDVSDDDVVALADAVAAALA